MFLLVLVSMGPNFSLGRRVLTFPQTSTFSALVLILTTAFAVFTEMEVREDAGVIGGDSVEEIDFGGRGMFETVVEGCEGSMEVYKG